MAAAAAFSSSRAVAGVTTTKGLFLIFSLLCLVCFTSSLMDKNQLEELKEKLEKGRKETDRLKENLKTEMATSSELINESIASLDQMIAVWKKTGSDDFPLLETYLEKVKSFMEKTKASIDSKNGELGAKIGETENELDKMNKLIKFLEENQAEL